MIKFRRDFSGEDCADIWFGKIPCFLFPNKLIVGCNVNKFFKIKQRLKLQELF